MALGVGEASAVNTTHFNNQAVDSTTVLVGYTYYGDANLDKRVNALDFNALAANYGAAGGYWYQGDFNFDGTVNSLDFNSLATNFGFALSSPAPANFAPSRQQVAQRIAVFRVMIFRYVSSLRSKVFLLSICSDIATSKRRWTAYL